MWRFAPLRVYIINKKEPQITQIPQIFLELILRSSLTPAGNLCNLRNLRFLTEDEDKFEDDGLTPSS